MITLLGALIGFATSFLPKVLDTFNQRQRNKFDLDKIKLQAELNAQYYRNQESLYETQGDRIEQELLLKHDTQISQEEGFIGGLRRAVRPLVTYCFFFFFMFFKIILVMEALKNGMDIMAVSGIIWDEQSQAIFAAIISFWFGSRAIEKLDRKS